MPLEYARKKATGWGRHWARVRKVLSQAALNFVEDECMTISASIAYFSILSLFPLMLLFVVVSSVYIGHYELSGQLAVVLQRYLPVKPDFIMRNLAGISRSHTRVTLLSLLLLLWSSSGVFLPLEKALNRAWDVKKERSWWRSRLLALEMALTFGFVMLVSSGLVGVNVFVHHWVRVRVYHPAGFLAEIAYPGGVVLATFALTLAMFLVLFQRLPNRSLQIRQVLPGAALTALFWEAARSLFTLLLPVFNYRHVYGSIAFVVALMTWAYVSSVVILFGAQVSNALYDTLEVDEPAFLQPVPSRP